MAKGKKQPAKTCADCIHETACRLWTDGQYISDASASRCTNHETVKESGAYYCGVLDERKRKQTNADRIRAMSDNELVDFLSRIDAPWCTNLAECQVVLTRDATISDDMCRKCVAEWLRQPAEGSNET